MTIETKFNIGDRVWILDDRQKPHKATQTTVLEINARIEEGDATPIIGYEVKIENSIGNCPEVCCFATREELIASL